MTRRFVRPALAALLLLLSPASMPAQDRAPKLVVILVVDQLRPDYLERHPEAMSGGLARLLREGAVFERGAYPYLNTVTCAGHSTIGTGALPYVHGMILNTWFDRQAGSSTSCTDDRAGRVVPYAGTASLAHS